MLCERRCGVDRLAGERAPCGLDAETWCFKRHMSLAEEPELLPSYMVYLGACNFRCRFCVQGPACFEPKRGTAVDAAEAAADLEDAVASGARTINLLGGEPGLHPHTILEIAAAAERPLPLVLNSNMYMTPDVFDLLDGVVTLYLADFKFGNDACAARLADIDRYVEIVTRNLRLASERADVMVRHLLMPGHVDCCFRPVAAWVAEHLPAARFSLMTGYVPTSRTPGCPEIDRGLTADERASAEAYARSLGLDGGAR
jgi:putative pyruvate formate lyase activating enzyme